MPRTKHQKWTTGVDGARTSTRRIHAEAFVLAKDRVLESFGPILPPDASAASQHDSPYLGEAHPYFSHPDQEAGYPETLRRMRAYPDEKLSLEKWSMRYATSDRMFGLPATRWVRLLDQVIRERALLKENGFPFNTEGRR